MEFFCNKGKRTQKFKNHDIGNEVLSKYLLATMLNVSYLKKVRIYLSNLFIKTTYDEYLYIYLLYACGTYQQIEVYYTVSLGTITIL